MTAIGWLQILIYCAIIVALTPLIGGYMTRVFGGERTFLSVMLRPVESALYRVGGVDETREQHWLTYTVAMLLFHVGGFVILYALMRLQAVLPFNPADQSAVAPDLAFNTAVSFITNTNWQNYGGESTMSYLVQMLHQWRRLLQRQRGTSVRESQRADELRPDHFDLRPRRRAALRHRMQRKAETPLLCTGDLEIDSVRHRATRAGVEIKLTPKEFELLSFLAKHPGRVLTHKQILAAVWGPAHTEDTQYLRVYVGQLRQKVGERPDDPRLILAEPGIGYRIADD